MIVQKVKYNNGNNEGYFIEVRTKEGTRYVKITVEEGITLDLKNIKSKKSVRMNAISLKLEEEEPLGSYIQ